MVLRACPWREPCRRRGRWTCAWTICCLGHLHGRKVLLRRLLRPLRGTSGFQSGSRRGRIYRRLQCHSLQRPGSELPHDRLAHLYDPILIDGCCFAGRLHNPGVDRFIGWRKRVVENQCQEHKDGDVDHHAQAHTHAVPPLGMGQPLYPAQRGEAAGAQETPSSQTANVQGIKINGRFRRFFRRHRQAVGQRVARPRIVLFPAIRCGRRDDRWRRKFAYPIGLGNHARGFGLCRFGLRRRF